MCIIIAKDKKCDRLPTQEELTNSFNYNSDGAGFMYVEDNKVIIDKGYMTLVDFMNKYEELCNKFDNFKDKSLVIHCRIGTSSGNTPENTHPYPIGGSEKELHKLQYKCDLGMVHNGIISSYTPTWKNPTTNDTQEFILKYVNVLYKNFKEFYKHQTILSGMKDITNSKLVFLDTEDNLYFVGDFTEEEGIKFSNKTYKSYTYSYSYGSTNHTPYNASKYDSASYSDYYDYWYDKYGYEYKINEEGEVEDSEGCLNDSMIYVDPTWYIVDGDNVELVGDRELYYDCDTRELYKVNDRGELVYHRSNIYVYSEEYDEVI